MKERIGATVIITDGGGRGAVLAEAYSKNPYVKKIIAVPGNDVISLNTGDTHVELHPELKTTSVNEIVDLAMREIKEEREEVLVNVAQDNAVAVGLTDALQKKGIPTDGPTQKAGQIESDKIWCRRTFDGINPQPSWAAFESKEEGIEYIRKSEDKPRFIKEAGLAEGKGAKAAKNNDEAIRRIAQMKSHFLIEDWLEGEEFSTFAICKDGSYQIIGSAQDHKTANNFDEGENTGGMGCSSRPLVLTPEIMQKVDEQIFKKTLVKMNDIGRPYNGTLYLGGMLVHGNPYVLEFNARWGDPEAQVIVPSLVSDLFEVSMAVAQGDIRSLKIQTDKKARVVVTGASRGYPDDYSKVKGKQIFGIDEAQKMDGVKIYGAGMKLVDSKYYASGGRLFYVVGEGKTVIDARQKAYEAMALISIEGNNLHFRTDIGWRDVARLRKVA